MGTGDPRSLRAIRALCGLALILALAACGGGHRASRDIYGPGPGGRYLIGKPYTVNGVWYYPAEDPAYSETGFASWYGREFHGNSTANGERFERGRLTAAHTTLPMPVIVRVTNLDNGKSILLRVNDRGPFVRGRIIDVSEAAAEKLGFRLQGTAQVRVEYVGRADGKAPLLAAEPAGPRAPDASSVKEAIAAIPPRGEDVPAY